MVTIVAAAMNHACIWTYPLNRRVLHDPIRAAHHVNGAIGPRRRVRATPALDHLRARGPLSRLRIVVLTSIQASGAVVTSHNVKAVICPSRGAASGPNRGHVRYWLPLINGYLQTLRRLRNRTYNASGKESVACRCNGGFTCKCRVTGRSTLCFSAPLLPPAT
jgi:hypothetical protein